MNCQLGQDYFMSYFLRGSRWISEIANTNHHPLKILCNLSCLFFIINCEDVPISKVSVSQIFNKTWLENSYGGLYSIK